MSAIIPFQFEAHAVRVQVDDLGQPWFNATDVCDALEMGNPSQAIKSHVDADDLQKLETHRRVAASAPTTSTNRASTP
jgi:prophage antirepressor-like protein